MPTYTYEVRIPVRLNLSGVDGDASAAEGKVQKLVSRVSRVRVAEEQKAARDVEKINAQTRRQAEQQDRLLERSARTLSQVRTREAKRAADEFARSLNQIERSAERTSSTSAGFFTKYLGVAFFAALGARAVSAFYDKAKDFVSRGVDLAQQFQNAMKGLTAEARFRGVDPAEVEKSVRGLRLVEGGIVSVAEAATTVKNLLATGFSLPQAITLFERFSDAAAFGKQAALGYGEAIRGASEGIKNQNSLLVDNVGVTKNISVILKEYGFEIQDLYDKQKGAAAREALYQGLLKETASQLGNANQLMQGYTGTVAAHELAQQNLQRTVGDYIINSPDYIEALKIQTETVNSYTVALGDANSESAKFAHDSVRAYAYIQAHALNFGASTINLLKTVVAAFQLTGNSIGVIFGGIADVILNSTNTFVNHVINGLGAIHNGIRTFLATIPGGAAVGQFLPGQFTPGNRLRTDFNLGGAAASGVQENLRTLAELSRQGARIDAETRRIDSLLDPGRLERQRRTREEIEGQRGLMRDQQRNEAGGGGAGAAAGEKAKRAARIIDEADKFSLSELKDIEEFFRAATGRALPISARGQSAYHNKLRLDHSRAADVALNPNSPHGQILLQYLRENEIPFRAFSGPYRRADGTLTSTGAHIHIGSPSRGFGKGVASRGITRQAGAGGTIVVDANGVPVPDEMLRLGLLPEGARLVQLQQESVSAFRENIQGLLRRQFAQPLSTTSSLAGYIQSPAERRQGGFDDRLYGARDERGRRRGGILEDLTHRREDIDFEAAFAGWETYVEWQNKALDLTVELRRAEVALGQARSQATDDQLTEQRRLLQTRTEELDLIQRLQALQDEDATRGANSALRAQVALLEERNRLNQEFEDLQNEVSISAETSAERYRNAWQRAINDVALADDNARLSMIESQVRLADQTVYHADRANAKVLDFLASQRGVTDILADARIGVMQSTFDFVDSALDRMTRKLGAIGDVVKDLIGGFVRLALTRFFQSAFGGGGGGGFSIGGGQQQGGGIGNILGGLFGGGRQGGVTVGGFSGGLFNVGQGGISIPQSLTSLDANTRRQLSLAALDMPNQAGGLGGLLGGGGGLGGLLGGGGSFSLGGLAGAASGLAPILGLALGGRIGGGLGSIGGGLAGVTGLALAQSFGLFGMGGGILSGGMAAGLTAAAPFLLPIAGALLVGGHFLKRSQERRKYETIRDQLSHDTGTRIWQLIGEAQRGRLTVSQAEAEWEQIRQRYFEGVGQLKESKTRRHAELQWQNDFTPLRAILLQNAKEGEERSKRYDAFVPTFAFGGSVAQRFADGGALSRFMGRVPGLYDRRDDRLIRVSGDETVLTPTHRARLGGPAAMAAAGVPGYADGGSMSPQPSGPIVIRVEKITVDAEGIVFEGLSSNVNKSVVIEYVAADTERGGATYSATRRKLVSRN